MLPSKDRKIDIYVWFNSVNRTWTWCQPISGPTSEAKGLTATSAHRLTPITQVTRFIPTWTSGHFVRILSRFRLRLPPFLFSLKQLSPSIYPGYDDLVMMTAKFVANQGICKNHSIEYVLRYFVVAACSPVLYGLCNVSSWCRLDCLWRRGVRTLTYRSASMCDWIKRANLLCCAVLRLVLYPIVQIQSVSGQEGELLMDLSLRSTSSHFPVTSFSHTNVGVCFGCRHS